MVGLVNAELSLVSHEKRLKERPKETKTSAMESFLSCMV
jgi:hypothetical protein